MRVATETDAAFTARHLEEDPGLSTALSDGLNIPLAALRASMEALLREVGERPLQATVNGALAEVERLGRNVQDLVDYATPVRPLPLRCTVEEILHAARNALRPAERPRVVVAHTAPRESLVVDGPLLARSLRRILQNALEAGSDQVLVVSRGGAERTSFVIVNDAADSFDPDWAVGAFHSSKRNHLGLGLALARRDLEQLGGRLEIGSGQTGETRVAVSVPTEPLTGGPQS